MAEESVDYVCCGIDCKKNATQFCPECRKYGLLKSSGAFCSRDCFRKSWKLHKLLHSFSVSKDDEIEVIPSNFGGFSFTGPLRPCVVRNPKERVRIGDDIEKPDYFESGEPFGEMKLRGSTKIEIRTDDEISKMRETCLIARKVLDAGARIIAPGVTTDEIDAVIHNEIVAKYKAYPSPFNYRGFPRSCCTSVNEVICHGIPDGRKLREGDILNIDVTVFKNGFHGDLNETYFVGNVDEKSRNLVQGTYDSLKTVSGLLKPGLLYREIGNRISKHINSLGYSVVTSYCGHGIGRLFHCAPNVPHYAKNKAVGILKKGHVFTIEPMINEGLRKDITWPDKWTAVTKDGKRSAQFEHTFLVTDQGVEVLTQRLPDSPVHHTVT